MNEHAVLIVGLDPVAVTALELALGAHQRIRAVGEVGAARAAIQSARPSAAVVHVRDGAPEPLQLIRSLSDAGVATVAVATRSDPEVILKAMRAGAREYLVEGDREPLTRSVQAFLESAGALKHGQLTAFFACKGGVGATTLSVNVAGALHRQANRVLVADLDLELGDVLAFLDLKGAYALSDVAANVRRLDRDLLDASVPRHGSGVWALSQCDKLDDAALEPAQAANVLRFVRTHYDHVIVDGLRDFGDVALAALDAADRIVLVVTQEVPAVRNAQRCAEILQRLGHDASRVLLVVNRFHKGSPITREVIEETVRLPVGAVVGNDFRSVSDAVSRGVLVADVAPRSVVARDIDALVASLVPAGSTVAAPRGGFLKNLFAPKAVLHGAG